MCLDETSAPPRSQTMHVPLRVLIAEDSEDDARLLLRELQHAGYQPTHERVDTPAAMTSALDRHGGRGVDPLVWDRKSTRLNSRHRQNSYSVFCLKKKKKT